MTVWRWDGQGETLTGLVGNGGLALSRELNSAIEFDCPFLLIPGEGSAAIVDGNDLPQLGRVYAPSVTCHPADGSLVIEEPAWVPVSGYSGQYRYSGPVMHASEQLSGGMARDLLEGVMGAGWFVVVAVEQETCDDYAAYGECGVSNPPADGDTLHECSDEPVGWMLLHRPVAFGGAL